MLAFLPGISQGQSGSNYLVHSWPSDSGLAQNWVTGMVQSPDGYLWIGTRYGGLARFDGVRFVHFTPQTTPALRDVQVERLTMDTQGALWISMVNRSVTGMRAGRFELFRHPRTEPQARLESFLATAGTRTLFTAESGVIAELDRSRSTDGWRMLRPVPEALAEQYSVYPAKTFHQDRKGHLWYVGRDQRLARYSAEGEARLPDDLQFPGDPVHALAVDGSGVLWVATAKRIVSWDGRALTDHRPAAAGELGQVRQLAFSGDGGLWVLEAQRLRKLLRGSWKAEADPAMLLNCTHQRHHQLYGDSAGGVWVVTYGGGVLHVRADGTTHQLTGKDGLPSEAITCWLEDHEGNIWLGTAAGGIARIRERVFKAYGVADGLPEKMVRSVGVDTRGGVWAGTMSGQLARWDDGKFTALSLPPAQTTPIAGISVFPGRSGKVWIGGLYQGLLVYEGGKISRPVAGLEPWIIQVLFEDSRNAVWLGCRGQLVRIADGKARVFGGTMGFPIGVPAGAIAEDADGVMWIGTEQGDLWRYKDDEFTRFHPPAEWPSSQIISLQTDANGVVWAGTLGNGLLRFKDGGFARFTASEGLPDNNVSQLLDDGIGGLWGGTFAGVFHVRKSELNELAAGALERPGCSVYGTQDGLPALECTSGFNPACWRADDGRLWFSTVNGIASVNPAAVRFNRRPPNVLIEELTVDGKLDSNFTPDGETGGGLKVGPGKHFLQFRFTGLSLAAPDKVRFRWKLEGVDRDWQDIGIQRVIGCGPLEPGRYRLRVRACNSDGVWNDEGATVAFTVLPHFWETWWFKVVAVSVSIAVIILALRRRYRLSMERLKRENEVEQERSRIARDLHDDLGTSLTQIIMLSSLANRDQTPPEKARQLIEQVGGRSKEMVTALDEIVWAVNPKNDTLVALVRYLGHFAEEMLQPAGIRCRLDIPHGLPAHPLSAEVRHHLFLAFKEALNNCIRHSGASLVQLGVDLKPDEVIISIKDDGRGFDPESGPSEEDGDGLTNIPGRMADIGGHAEIQSAPGRGTTVTLRLPLAARSGR